MNIVERFLKYVSFTTTSDDKTEMTPSTPGQMIFAQSLVNELKGVGLEEVEVDENGYVMATLPSNCTPKLRFIVSFSSSIPPAG